MSDSEEENFQAELPEWAQIQRKTFTRWCNQQLKPRSLEIEDLQVGLKDGVNLINLVELLTQHASPTRYTKKPRIKMQMMENIGIGLKILTDDGIKLVNIGNSDIYEGNMKLILGLIWTLILHYQISMEFEGGKGDGGSAKKQLQDWATDLIKNLPDGKSVRNFTTDWNDGVALCCMVEAVAPGLCPEYNSLDPNDKLENARLGLERAEQGLGVPKIIEAEDLVNPNIDELSVLTYVSLLKNATPTIDLVPSDPFKIKIYGPGTETAWVNTPTQFFIDTTGAGYGKLDVEIKDCHGNSVPMELWKKDNETKVQYTPKIPGPHRFNVTYNKNEVPNGKFTVKVLAPTDSSKIVLSGDGLEKAFVNKPTHFFVDAAEAGVGDLSVTIVGPGGKIPVDTVYDEDTMKYTVHYTPDKAGPVLITVKYAGNEVDGCPFHVDVVDDVDPLKIKILTKGLESPVVGKEMKFAVCTVGAGNGDLKVTVVDDDGHPLKVTIGDIDPDNKEVKFTPEHPGKHRVSVTWSGQPVPDGDIDLEVKKPLDLLACIVSDVNTNPLVGTPTHFSVDCSKVGSDDLKVEILDSNGAPLEVTIDNLGSGRFTASYTAQSVDPLKVHVKIEDNHIPSSPTTVHPIDPSKIIVTVNSDKDWKVGEQVELAVDITGAGPGQLGINLSAPPGSGTDCHAKEVSPGHMTVVFTPSSSGDHIVNLTYSDNNVPATPVVIKVVPRADVKAVIVSGDGIREGQVGKTAVFTIDASAAGPGDLDVKVRGPKNPIDVTPVEIGDGLYEVSYTPSEEGSHIIAVKYADQHVPGSAFSVDVIDDRSDPITYQMTEMQSASEPLPLARWPNTFLKTPEEELEEIPEGSGVIPEEEAEEPQKPSSSSSSSSSYTSTATLIARENEARRAAFERQWNSYLARTPSPEPPPAHRVSTEEEEEEEEKEEEEESRMTPDQSHNLMTYDSHVQGQLDLVDDAYDEVTRTYYDSHAADSPLEKKSSSSSSDTARSTVKDESPPMRTLEDYLSKISTSSSSSQKSSFVLVEKQPEVTESDIYYKIATEPVLPRAPSPMSSDTDTSSHSRKALEKRIARRRELSRQWSEQYFPTTSSLLNPVVFRESTVEDHTRSSKPVSPTPRKIDVPREKSSSSSSEHDETFTNKLHFFRRNSISSTAPLPTYSQRTASSLPSIHSRRPIVSPERPDIPPRTPITPDRYSPSPSPEPAVTPEKSLTSEKSPSPSRNSFNLSTLLAKVTDDKSKSSSSSSESIVLPKPVKTCSIGVQADLIETCSYNCKSKEKSVQEKGVQKEDSQKISEKIEVKENKTKRNGEETKAEPEKEKTQSIPDDTKSTWPAFDINLPKFGGEKEPEPEVLIDWKYKPARKKSEVEYRRWNLKSPTPEREQQEPIVEEKVDRHSDNDKKFTFPNFDINLPSFKREEKSPSVSEKEEKVETKAKEPVKEGQEEGKKFELNFPNFEINLPTFKKEEKSPTTPEQEDGIKKEADDESAEKRPEDEKRFDLNFPKFDIDLPKFSRDSESNKPASPEKRESSKEKKDDERNDKQSDSLFRLPSMELNFWKSEDNPKENLKSDEKEVNWVYKPRKGSDSPTEKRWRKEQSEESSSSSYESSSSETPPPRPPKSPGRRKPQLLRRDSSFGTELERQQYLREIRNRPKVYNEDIKNSKNAYERETGIGRQNEDNGEKNKWHDLTASERAELLDKQLRKGRDLDKAREEVKPGPKKHSSLPRMSSGNVNRWGGTYPEEERPRTLERRKSVVEDRIEQIFNKSEVSSEARSPSPVRWNFVRNTVYRRTDGSIPEPKKDNYAELRSTSPIIVGSSNGYKVKEKKPEKKPGKIPEGKPESAKPKKQHPIVEPEKPRKTSTWAQEWAQKRNLLVTNEPSSSSSSSESYEEYYVKKFPKSTPVKRTKPAAEPVQKQMADPKPILKSSKSKDPIRSQPISPVYRVQVREKMPEEKRSNPKSKKGTKNRKGNGRSRKKYSSSSSSSYSYNSSDSDTSTPTSYFPKSSKKQPPPKPSPSPVTPPPYLPFKNDLNSNRSESYRRPRSRSRISADDSWIKNNFDDHDESVMYEQNLPEDLQPWYGRK